jgi:hypothetical protein
VTARPTRDELLAHLVASRIAGDVDTPRESNLRALLRLTRLDPHSWFGLRPGRPWTYDELFAVMVERCGIDPDAERTSGADRIDPDLTVAALDDARECMRAAAAEQRDVFVATGHPAGVLAIHLRVAAYLRDAGCRLLEPGAGMRVQYADRRRQVRYVAGVAVLSDRGELNHTHSAVPMQQLLAEGLRPGLVVADHGWAGAAGEAGLEVVAFADCNDPALFVGAATGRVGVVVPLDDNVLPHLYDPVSDYLLGD